MRKILILLVGMALAPAAAQAAENLPAIAPVMACADLAQAGVDLKDAPTTISSAAVADVDGHHMCVVKGTVSPRVSFEVRLPVAGWTQRYLQTGCGGLCGRVDLQSPQRDCTPETNGEMALATTDMGHDTSGGTWAASDMQARVDFGYRGVHVTALVAKALIRTYYGQDAKWSYFSGCSDGGREALMEAQRYPDDFNGIAAGAPALNFLVQNSFYHAWNVHVVDPYGPKPALSEADLPILHAGAIAACDAQDGTTDGLISDPGACKFDPKTLICAKGQTDNCLTEAAANAAAELYRGAHDGDTALVVASVLPGSELNWGGVQVLSTKLPGGMAPKGDAAPGGAPGAAPAGAAPAGGDAAPAAPAGSYVGGSQPAGFKGMAISPSAASDMLKSLAYVTPYDPNWTLPDFKFTAASLDPMRPMHAIYDATNPDLSPFAQAGGKLILWHGLADPHISPLNTVGYVQAVRDTIGADKTDATLRLFLIPGMSHCGGGEGLTSIDVMTPLMDWVEDAKAPASLIASATDEDAAAGKGRTLFPYPAVSVLRDGGNADTPADWQPAKAPLTVAPAVYKNWAGADFFKPGFQKFCGFDGLNFVCKP